MVKTTVEIEYENAILTKGDDKIAIIMKNIRKANRKEFWYVYIISLTQLVDDNEPLIMLVKRFENAAETYSKWLMLIGKLCRKKSNSKYFSSPHMNEHLNNGDELKEYEKRILTKYSKEDYKRLLRR